MAGGAGYGQLGTPSAGGQAGANYAKSAAAPKSKGCHWWPIIVFILFVVGGTVGGLFVAGKFFDAGPLGPQKANSQADDLKDTDGQLSDNNAGKSAIAKCKDGEVLISGKCQKSSCDSGKYLTANGKCDTCPALPDDGKLIVFWGSERDGCDTLPKEVDVVIVGFVEITNNAIDHEFQGNSATLQKCIKNWQNQCIKVLASVGGAGNVEKGKKFQVTNPGLFAQNMKKLVDKYGFDGVDIDDETTNKDGFNRDQVVAYTKALRDALPSPKYIISYDALAFEANALCNGDFSRCFPTGIKDSVDWVNVMFYNIFEKDDDAKSAYQRAMDIDFKNYTSLVGSKKVVPGLCTGSGCVFGLGPAEGYPKKGDLDFNVVNSWAANAEAGSYGGIMLFSASLDKSELQYQYTNNLIDVLKRRKEYLPTKKS